METQETIGRWADEAFGKAASLWVIVSRLHAEELELLKAVDHGAPEAIRDEAADVAIVLYRLAQVAGFDLARAVNEKMAVNRQRKWMVFGDGTGQHVRA